MPINVKGSIVTSDDVFDNGDYKQTVVRAGLKIYLDAYHPLSYTGGTTIWRDISGYDNHCYWDAVNPPTWSSNASGSFDFNGTTDYGTIYINDTLNFSEEQTVIMWLFKSGNAWRMNPWNQAYGGWGTWTDEDTPDFYINHYFGDAGSNTTPYVAVRSDDRPVGVWKMAAITRNTSRGVAYTDGKRATTYGESTASGASTVNHTYGTLTTDSNNILIGNGYAGYFYGYIGAVLAYTRCLHPYEIAQNFQALRERFGI